MCYTESTEYHQGEIKMQVIAITPDQFDPTIHSLPTAGELLLPGTQAEIHADGIAREIKQPVIESHSFGMVIELCKKGELVEIAVTSDQEADGGYYFEQFWVVMD